MAEPSTGALALAGVLSGVGAGVAFPQIDLAVLVGAFFYVVFAKDMTSLRRLGYLVAGWIGGGFGAAELLGRAWTKTADFSGFLYGSLCVVVFAGIVGSRWAINFMVLQLQHSTARTSSWPRP